MSAAAPLTLNTSRLVYLQDNAQIVADTLAKLPDGWRGILLMVTNPVDALCTWLHRRGGLDRSQILGYTLNDSLRLRTGVSNATGVPPHSVEAWVIGEHGDTSVPLFDRVRIDGHPVVLDEDEEAAALEFIRTWYTRHVALDSGRTSTWTSGLGIARMIDVIAGGSDEIWPASVRLDGEYGLENVSLSVPVVLGRRGLERIVEWELTPGQQSALAASATAVREATDRIGVETELDTATAGKERT
jgi:malate/lactate dehydrogenase